MVGLGILFGAFGTDNNVVKEVCVKKIDLILKKLSVYRQCLHINVFSGSKN